MNIVREIPSGKALLGTKSSKLTRYAYIAGRTLKFTRMDQISRARVSGSQLQDFARTRAICELAIAVIHA